MYIFHAIDIDPTELDDEAKKIVAQSISFSDWTTFIRELDLTVAHSDTRHQLIGIDEEPLRVWLTYGPRIHENLSFATLIHYSGDRKSTHLYAETLLPTYSLYDLAEICRAEQQAHDIEQQRKLQTGAVPGLPKRSPPRHQRSLPHSTPEPEELSEDTAFSSTD